MASAGGSRSVLLMLTVALLLGLANASKSFPSPKHSPPKHSLKHKAKGPKKASCQDKKNFPFCRFQVFFCPAKCPLSCSVDCKTCSPVCDCEKPGSVCQDPKFIGADGITFYFHGKKDNDFCLVTDSNLHINGHFIGKRNDNMRRDFTWVQSLGILFGDHKLYVGALKTATWKDSVDRLALSLDGEPIDIPLNEGAVWKSASGALTITRAQSTNAVEIEAEGNFKIKAVVVPITQKDSLIHNYGITDDDCFAHLDLSFKFLSLGATVNGVLGQTYAPTYVSRVKIGATMPVLGGNREFASSGIFSTDCSVSKFTGTTASDSVEVFSDLSCASGIDGRGVVCKR